MLHTRQETGEQWSEPDASTRPGRYLTSIHQYIMSEVEDSRDYIIALSIPETELLVAVLRRE